MKRIGIAASHMSKGNIWMYNLFVILLSSMVSIFLFLLIGSTMLFALLVIAYLGRELNLTDMGRSDWIGVFKICMIVLTVMVGLWNLIAVSRNIRLKRPRHKG